MGKILIIKGADFSQVAVNEVDPQIGVKITVLASPTGGGTVAGGGTYEEGTQVTISATPASGYHFVEWSDGDTNATRTITVGSTPQSYTALFKQVGVYTWVYNLQETFSIDADKSLGISNTAWMDSLEMSATYVGSRTILALNIYVLAGGKFGIYKVDKRSSQTANLSNVTLLKELTMDSGWNVVDLPSAVDFKTNEIIVRALDNTAKYAYQTTSHSASSYTFGAQTGGTTATYTRTVDDVILGIDFGY